MNPRPGTGLLLINLGTPESPAVGDVRRYLKQFLMDPRVIDIPTWRRWLLLHLLILPTRPRESGKAYEKVWTAEGSPLLTHSIHLVEQVRRRLADASLDVRVELGMRYGNPSIPAALARLKEQGVDRIVVFPLYPQYSSAATGSSLEELYAAASTHWNVPNLQVIPPFYDHPAFIGPCAAVARPIIEETRPERVFFSFHGLPERQVIKSDEGGGHCLKADDCCARMSDLNRNCYRAQCFATARALADRLGVPEEQRVICFQSRLGKTPWIRPYTDELLVEEARRGIRRAVILSPAFVADCLETIEELGIRAVHDWKQAGGESLTLVPAVNARDDWADGLLTIARETTSWLGPQSSSAETILPTAIGG